jgi:flagellar hook-associated protein 1 FlgK
MGGLFGALNNSVSALQALQRALDVTQNNVSNASTPGYARQIQPLEASAFDPPKGLLGGVQAGAVQSTRSEYSEQAVRSQTSLLGNFSAQAQALSGVEPLFDVSGKSGIDGALNNLFQSFSAWSAAPSDPSARQDVLAKAQDVATAFHDAAAGLSQATQSVNQQLGASVQQINSLAATIRDYNVAIAQGGQHDAGLDAKLHSALESLAQQGDITARFEQDGTVTVLLGGQTPVVIGNQQNAISLSVTGSAHVLDSNGTDITSQISGGTLGGLLSVRNTVLPSLQGDGVQQGSLNQLAQKVADRVNQILSSSLVSTSPLQSGQPLFAYSANSVASTLKLDPNITAAKLAAIDPGPPVVANGAALTLSNLGNSTAAADQINGQTILQFYSSMAAQVGQQVSNANDGQDLHTQLLAQAQAFRTQVSGVSLDQEAAQVLQLQQGFQAASKMVAVVETLTLSLIDIPVV